MSKKFCKIEIFKKVFLPILRKCNKENAYPDETVVRVMPELESKYQAISPSSDPAIIFHKNSFVDSQFDSKVTPKFSFF